MAFTLRALLARGIGAKCLVSGELPDGLFLVDSGESSNGARVCGVPTRAGTFTFTLGCDNFANGIETSAFAIQVVESGGLDDESELKKIQEALAATQEELAKAQEELAVVQGELGKMRGGLAAAIARADALEAVVRHLQTQLPQRVVINTKTVNAKRVKAALKKAHNAHATSVTIGSKVKTIKTSAFRGTSVKRLVVASTKLSKKSVKDSLKGSKVKVIQVKVVKSKQAKVRKTCRAFFAKKNSGRKVIVK